MESTRTVGRIRLQHILHLTDFSEPSSTALRYAVVMAREYGATVHALHVLTPEREAYAGTSLSSLASEAQEEMAQMEMQRVASALAGVAYEANIVRGTTIWSAVQRVLEEYKADLIVLGTHGRTGKEKMLLGSVAEEIFRRSPVPVLTTGPQARQQVHNAGRFRRVLFATGFSADSMPALPYALSLAQETGARIILLHVIRRQAETAPQAELSVAGAMHRLHELLPPGTEAWCRPETAVEYGEPASRILHVAAQCSADLLVLGARCAMEHLAAATHQGRTTAHQVVVHAKCPVLTVRG